jgi:hypothetical protein
MALQTAVSYNGSNKILQRQALSWDCPFNSGKSKQLSLESKALEDTNSAYYNLSLFYCFYWAVSNFTVNRLSMPNFGKLMPKPPDEIS